ncbi:hypothetical protein FKW77_003124 [Venturia effusa]|uniref:Uncharacterized protein n=1 Tax=Venturia effusa TaxID=50376 RepID=A0A517LPT7_9PEZI|nr:hypothetical protein FKW77_003124 [Venturia effusa]
MVIMMPTAVIGAAASRGAVIRNPTITSFDFATGITMDCPKCSRPHHHHKTVLHFSPRGNLRMNTIRCDNEQCGASMLELGSCFLPFPFNIDRANGKSIRSGLATSAQVVGGIGSPAVNVPIAATDEDTTRAIRKHLLRTKHRFNISKSFQRFVNRPRSRQTSVAHPQAQRSSSDLNVPTTPRETTSSRFIPSDEANKSDHLRTPNQSSLAYVFGQPPPLTRRRRSAPPVGYSHRCECFGHCHCFLFHGNLSYVPRNLNDVASASDRSIASGPRPPQSHNAEHDLLGIADLDAPPSMGSNHLLSQKNTELSDGSSAGVMNVPCPRAMEEDSDADTEIRPHGITTGDEANGHPAGGNVFPEIDRDVEMNGQIGTLDHVDSISHEDSNHAQETDVVLENTNNNGYVALPRPHVLEAVSQYSNIRESEDVYTNGTSRWMGKGGNTSTSSAEGHQSRPLSALKDPSSFGPPPKRTTGPYTPAPAVSTTRTDTGLSEASIPESQEAARQIEAPPVPSGPYRADTTGLSTAHLPKPPAFRPGERSESPVAIPSGRPKPALPPRLPPRNPSSSSISPSPPPPYSDRQPAADPSRGLLNQGAMNRLGQAGVSVPGFGISGRTPPLPPPSRTSASPPLPIRANTDSPPIPSRTGGSAAPPSINPAATGPQLGELQSRFAKMNTASTPPAAGGGTTWAQKQAALKMASDFKKDPSSVSFSDARNAASTANNFRERHGEQAAAGYAAANNLNQKYGIMNKVKSYSADGSASQQVAPAPVGLKKAPPPPPVKRSDLLAGPPPVPLSSKPRP